MAQLMSREERKKAYLKSAERLFEEMEDWYDDHENASFEAIEAQARVSRRRLMGEAMQIFINGRDVGKSEEAPHCPDCQKRMRYKGLVKKTVYGLEGDTALKRAYYHCPNKCENGRFFPSG